MNTPHSPALAAIVPGAAGTGRQPLPPDDAGPLSTTARQEPGP